MTVTKTQADEASLDSEEASLDPEELSLSPEKVSLDSEETSLEHEEITSVIVSDESSPLRPKTLPGVRKAERIP